MLYLKNTLGGLSRSLSDSALSRFQGPHRWWKLALFAGLIVLPGGSVGVAILAWIEHRRGGKGGKKGNAAAAAVPRLANGASVETSGAAAKKGVSAASGATAATASASHTSACKARGDAACRAAAGKLARKTPSTDVRV